MFGIDYCRAEGFVFLDSGEIYCRECFEREIRDSARSRYSDRSDAEHLTALAMDLIFDLESGRSRERNRAERILGRILDVPPGSINPVTSYALDEWAYDDPFLACDSCGEFFRPERVDDMVSTDETLQAFLALGRNSVDACRWAVGDREFLQEYMRQENFVAGSDKAERFLSGNWFINDDVSGIMFFRKGDPTLPFSLIELEDGGPFVLVSWHSALDVEKFFSDAGEARDATENFADYPSAIDGWAKTTDADLEEIREYLEFVDAVFEGINVTSRTYWKKFKF